MSAIYIYIHSLIFILDVFHAEDLFDKELQTACLNGPPAVFDNCLEREVLLPFFGLL